MTQIPVIDISPLRGDDAAARGDCVTAILQACRDIGFLTITGTGVDANLVANMRATVRDIFDLGEDEKWRQAITRDNYRGYIPMGFFTPNDGSGQADKYEGYKLHFDVAANAPVTRDCALYGPNLWPDHTPHARDAVLAYWAALDAVADDLLRALAQGLDLPADTFTAGFKTPMTNMTLLHYPPQAPDEAGFGIHPHKDTDALTIIAPDPVGGLEVRLPNGDWITPDCPEGSFVVNIGDMLELWSGGRLVSTPHRVINKSGKERYSFPYFAVPRHDVVVAPALPPLDGHDRGEIHCGHWSAEVWRTNWPDETAQDDGLNLGTIR